ncbi:MAG TPA: phosphate acetyltransferase [Polyangiaceae bacterium]|jgi:phosphate acetyltransferase|nr:phosphate acetyltransferase [Polyangiaceae bacterium]
MPHTLYLVPSGQGAGLTSLALGLVRALDNRGIRVAFYKPIGQQRPDDTGPERSTYFVRHTSALVPSAPIPSDEARRLLASGRTDELLERVMGGFHESTRGADVVVVEGLVDLHETSGEEELNERLVRTLSAEVIFVGALGATSPAELAARFAFSASHYGGLRAPGVLGAIVNRVRSGEQGSRPSIYGEVTPAPNPLPESSLKVIGVVPENPELTAYRTLDVARHLGATVVSEGELAERRVRKISLLARTVPNLVNELTAGALLVTPGDRSDIVLAVALAVMNKVPIAGLVLTGGLEVPDAVLELCRPALETGLPVLAVAGSSWETAQALAQMTAEIPVDDLPRIERVMDYIAKHVDADFIARHCALPVETRLSPAAFCYRLTERARSLKKRIVLPEGEEPRTVQAAAICAERGMARCVLLGSPDVVRRVARAQDVLLPSGVEIVDPAEVRARYVAPLVELRKHKGLTAQKASELLEDNVWVGTMMLAQGEVDGLVSGAVHSTANTIRPALQIIKTSPGAKVVSSIFFMCLPEQVVVYGDCAVIPEPDVETLADIAIQSADSAVRFGLPARVAMISYSTGASGSGSDVDKVRAATERARALRPELLIDGPLQYDAAAIPDVAKTKAPSSPVAGRATVFIFPDLNTGNTTYKAVQRSANVVSIGPMLQGMRRPVNDLSRGALVEDIVYTIALTAIQADQGPGGA